MKFMLMIYIDDRLLDALPAGEADAMLHGCFVHTDALRDSGHLLDSQQLEAPATARALRVRDGRTRIVDGPFAETKEILAGFNLIEADSIDQAMRIAQEFPWARTGCIEVRPVRDLAAVRRGVGA